MRQEPLVLAIETSGRIGSAAVAAGGQMLEEIRFSAPLRHSAEIFPAIRGLLNRSGYKPGGIEHVYISAGPGSFTGLRIAVAIAKMINLANSAKIVAVDTMDVIAANVKPAAHAGINDIATILDAKRGQFFAAAYHRNGNHWSKTIADCLTTPEQFLKKSAGRPVWLMGEGLVYYKDMFKAKDISFFEEGLWSPRAAMVHSIGWEKSLSGLFTDAITLQPTYLRNPQIGKDG